MPGLAFNRFGSSVGTRTDRPSRPPRRKTTSSVPSVAALSAASDTRAVISCADRAATPSPSPPARMRRRVNPELQRAARSVASAVTAAACARMAASAYVGPSRRQSGQSGCRTDSVSVRAGSSTDGRADGVSGWSGALVLTMTYSSEWADEVHGGLVRPGMQK